MRSFYTIEAACDTPETGSQYPQVQKMAPGYDYKAPDSVHALSRFYDRLPEFIPNLDYFVLARGAKPTDLLSTAPCSGGFLISPLFRRIIEKFTLPLHKFYPTKVSYKKIFLEYYWMHFICDLSDTVDYPNSTFYVSQVSDLNLGYISIDSRNDFFQKREKLKKDNPGKYVTINAEKIAFQPGLEPQLDMFQFLYIGVGSDYISNALRKAILDNKLTGVKINPATKLVCI